jgi:hypothetical protein
MAWSSAVLAARETAGLAADKPLIAVQVLPISPTAEKWTESANCGTGTDRTLATKPALRAYDGLPGLPTTPNTTLSNTWYYYLDVGAATVEFDCAFIIGHNFDTIALTDVELHIADNAAFDSNLQTIYDFGNPASDDRLAALSLFHTGAVARRYTGVRYLRLKMVAAGNVTPSIGELVLGRRFQLDRRPDVPFNPDALVNSFSVAKTIGGVSIRTNMHRNMFALQAEWPVDDTDQISDWVSFWQLCRGPFVWIYQPSTLPNSWHLMMLLGESLDFPYEQALVRMARIEAEEQGPDEYFLANE